MNNYRTTKTHIDMIRPGDTVLHNGELRTVCKSDLKRCGLMGTSLFGDCYRLGNAPVEVARAIPAL